MLTPPLLHVLTSFHSTAVNVSIGEAKGQTVLPMPAADTQQPDQTAKDRASIHILEKAVVVWSKQIKAVLKSDPDVVLRVSTQQLVKSRFGCSDHDPRHITPACLLSESSRCLLCTSESWHIPWSSG